MFDKLQLVVANRQTKVYRTIQDVCLTLPRNIYARAEIRVNTTSRLSLSGRYERSGILFRIPRFSLTVLLHYVSAVAPVHARSRLRPPKPHDTHFSLHWIWEHARGRWSPAKVETNPPGGRSVARCLLLRPLVPSPADRRGRCLLRPVCIS